MNTDKLYIGKGTPDMFDDYLDFINYVFGFNGNSSDFKKLLPKLYRPEYDPCAHSYFVCEDGKMKSAIGAYDHDISVCGRYLKTRGIGNVAVHPYARSRGYMKKLMTMAVDDMVKDGVVLSVLGGRRQRYRYFSYDKEGMKYRFVINSDNVRHTFEDEPGKLFTFVKVRREDTGLIEKIRELSASMPLHALRDNADYYDILISWQCSVHAALIDGKFAGYFIEKDADVEELLLTEENEKYLREMVRDMYPYLRHGNMTIRIPAYLNRYVLMIQDIGEGYSIEACKSFSVLNYRTVLEAFMELKTTYSHLPDGRLVFDIDGRGGREKIAVEVVDGKPSVMNTDDDADFTLGHIDAQNLFFAPICAEREMLPDFARLWFPLPLYLYYADAV